MLKSKLQNKEITIGTWITIPHSSVIEILASAGFEWMVIDMEHSAISIESAADMIRVIQSCNVKALVRVSKNEEVVIKQVLDAGADGIVVPMIKNKSDIEQAINFTYYPPIGKRGVGLSRAQNYGTGFDEYEKMHKEDLVVIAQIEHIDAVENLDDILQNEYLDGIIVGPYDLSGSMGKPGQYDEEDVKSALNRIEKVCKKSEKSLGFHVIHSDHKKMIEKINLDYSFIAFSLDFFFLGDLARKEMSHLKEFIK